jgi:subtilisin-like proprotein convertase family protein/subtilisin family serine protease
MNRILKIFVSGPEQDLLAEEVQVIESYPGFLLATLPQQAVAEVSAGYPVEDITELYRIRAGHRQLDTDQPRINQAGKTRSHPDYKGVRKLSPGAHHYLVQFIGPVKKQWLTAVTKAGGKIQAPQAGFSYVVRADEKNLAKIAALPFVRWTGHLCHSDRIAASVTKFANRRSGEAGAELPRTRVLAGLYQVEFYDTKTLKAASAEIKSLGFEILESDAHAQLMIVQAPTGRGNLKRLRELSAVHGLRHIREHSLKRTSNDLAPRLMGAAQIIDTDGLGLDGSGEVVTVCDTGLDTGNASSIHVDFRGRIKRILSYPIRPYYSRYINNPGGDDGAADFDSGHGTHVAGSVLGDGSASNGLGGIEGPIRGLAHKAKLVFQAVEQEMQWKNANFYASYGRYLLSGIPNDLQTLFADAYAQGARIHSNSWGGGDPGAYDSQCTQLDRFVWEHKDFCILVAAGNDGSDADGDGQINPMSVSSPATAKNCICIGACENERPSFNAARYGGWWPADYPAAPYKNDPMANNPDEVVAFSSRGPTEDGRIRPDVLAPGTFVLSTRSSMIAANNSAWAGFPASRKYFHMGGTSMATPLAAGAATLVRQYLRRDAAISNPSAALIRAALVAGAQRLPGQGDVGALYDFHQGFGRIDLQAVLTPQQPAVTEFIDISTGLETGEIWTRELMIGSSDVPLRAVMCYSDYPGENLVNNLNLILTAPDGTRHVGNRSSEGGLTMDAANNVELIQIDLPVPGTWRMEVVASNVSQGEQDFALVLIAAVGEPAADSLLRLTQQPNRAIPDNDITGIDDEIMVDSSGALASIAVEIDISHSYIGDLLLELTSPEGLSVVLHDRQGASTNNLRKRFDAHSNPELQLFTDTNIAGAWQLHVSDHARIDTGQLNRWTLELGIAPVEVLEAESEAALAIPDNKPGGIADEIEFSNSGQVESLEVWIDITHTWIGDLQVRLTAADGTNLLLHDRSGGSRDNLITIYDRDTLPALDVFVNTAAAGPWTLTVSDNAGRDTGKLNAWGLRIKL